MTHPAKYLRPSDVQHALQALKQNDLTIAAGCTDLFPATERKILPGDILDVTGVSELRGIRMSDAGLWIGATTTWRDIVEADLPAALAGLQLAAREVGALQIQNRGTIAGNLCNASPAADGVPPLLTLDAEVVLSSLRGTRQVPLRDFIVGPRRVMRDADELLTHVFIPRAALSGRGAFLKLGARKYLVISIVMVAARVEVVEGAVTAAALSVGACGPVATRLPDLEGELIGHPPSGHVVTQEKVAAVLAPTSDIRADVAYRIHSATELLRRVLDDLGTQVDQAA
ncbi:FAD binding domain-containing protein [Roseobacter sp. YSTF-M11]|uniref:FAD binding domain-containing protein n=1 Tax=Roseobacter insulae TaxID=2859783 RepID=A0A9X1K1H6_9RHOB|nr:FAD binding domain-containing protein [Roseobacter insulae]MBW4707518.1 FAD binding domain-containing protein [Roseobacter insulae]